MKIKFDRSSVCMGDDCFSHEEVKENVEYVMFEQLIGEVTASYPMGCPWSIELWRWKGQKWDTWEIGKLQPTHDSYHRYVAALKPYYVGKLTGQVLQDGDEIKFNPE